MPVKSKYRIAYLGEGDAYGIVELTPEEFEVVRRVLDKKNWETPYFDDWCPTAFIEPYLEDEDFWTCEPDGEIEAVFERGAAYGI